MNLSPYIFKGVDEAKTLKDMKEAIPNLIEELGFEITNELEPRIVSLERKRNRTRKRGR